MGLLEIMMAALVSLTGSSWISPENGRQSLEFKSSLVSGNAGCNTFRGSYTQTENGLKFTNFATTRMACKPAIMEQEFKFLASLQNTAKVELSATTLTLKDSQGTTLKVLNRKNAG